MRVVRDHPQLSALRCDESCSLLCSLGPASFNSDKARPPACLRMSVVGLAGL